MSFPVMLNSTNKVDANNYKVSLASNMNLTNYEVAVENLFMYNSWNTISAALNNNKIRLIIPLGGGSSFNNILTIPDGQYDIDTLNKWLQNKFIYTYNTYLINSNKENVFYASFSINPGTYQVQFQSNYIPGTLPSGWSLPSLNEGWTLYGLPSSGSFIQIEIYTNNGLKDILGFNPGTYPSSPNYAGTYYYFKLSDYIPNVNPISSIQMRLNCVYNEFASDSRLVHCFTNNNALFGEMIDASPNSPTFIPCSNNSFKEIIASFYDQNGNNLNILDSNLLIKLLFKKASS